jgi:hypothetical protein
LFCSYTPPINVYDAENLCYEKGIFVLEFLPTKMARQKYAGIVVASDAMRCDADFIRNFNSLFHGVAL